jgi:NADPH-dependent glutamate synthase beta subunit-like oxidoreductase
MPEDWIPLLEDPRKYLNLPEPGSGTAPERVAIVGAGMAGLTLAWVLVQLGMSVSAALFSNEPQPSYAR